jgi:hypothetical protein
MKKKHFGIDFTEKRYLFLKEKKKETGYSMTTLINMLIDEAIETEIKKRKEK